MVFCISEASNWIRVCMVVQGSAHDVWRILFVGFATNRYKPYPRFPLCFVKVAGTDLVARMAKLGAVAAVQPSFVPSDAAVVVKRLRCVFPTRLLFHALGKDKVRDLQANISWRNKLVGV